MDNTERKFTEMVKEYRKTIYTVCYFFSNDKEEVNDLHAMCYAYGFEKNMLEKYNPTYGNDNEYAVAAAGYSNYIQQLPSDEAYALYNFLRHHHCVWQPCCH